MGDTMSDGWYVVMMCLSCGTVTERVLPPSFRTEMECQQAELAIMLMLRIPPGMVIAFDCRQHKGEDA